MNEARERAGLLGRANGDSSHVIRVFDVEAQALRSVRSSSRVLQEATSVGEAILSKYAGQREHLKVPFGEHRGVVHWILSSKIGILELISKCEGNKKGIQQNTE